MSKIVSLITDSEDQVRFNSLSFVSALSSSSFFPVRILVTRGKLFVYLTTLLLENTSQNKISDIELQLVLEIVCDVIESDKESAEILVERHI